MKCHCGLDATFLFTSMTLMDADNIIVDNYKCSNQHIFNVIHDEKTCKVLSCEYYNKYQLLWRNVCQL